MTTDFDVVRAGREAGRLLRDPSFVAAITRTEQQILTEWADSHPSEVGRREWLHAELRGVRRFKGRLAAMEIDGKRVDDQRSLRA
jgi:hypothetical protein